MAARFNTDDHTYLGITCDKCGKEAPAAREIMAGHGLRNMGWYCSGGVHVCPKCPRP